MSWVEGLLIVITGVILFKPSEILALYQKIIHILSQIKAYFAAQEEQLSHNIKLEWLNEKLHQDDDEAKPHD